MRLSVVADNRAKADNHAKAVAFQPIDDETLKSLPAALSVRQVARLLQCEIHFAYRLIYLGKLPAMRLGKRTWRVPSVGLQRVLTPPI
ncbi:MAG TPA: helix-turn-helix domain-containing protein [Candidatus Eremiobacteraceae bacterium]|nr:helix-turn-helix domain-containing protein [Candidatus Eremiobacteraceae bacterium]